MDSKGEFGPVKRSPFIRECFSAKDYCLSPCSQLSEVYAYLTGHILQRSLKASGLTFSVILLLHLSAEFDSVTTLCFVKHFSPLCLGNLIFLDTPPPTSETCIQFLSLAVCTLIKVLCAFTKCISLLGVVDEKGHCKKSESNLTE